MVVAFVDDTDFFVNREDLIQVMTKILEEYKVLFKAIGGKIQFQKTFCFIWQQKWKNGQKYIQQLQIELKIDIIKIKQLPIEEGVRSLGIWINPENQQNLQFKIMVNRIKTAMTKFE